MRVVSAIGGRPDEIVRDAPGHCSPHADPRERRRRDLGTGIQQPEEFRTVTGSHVPAWRAGLERWVLQQPAERTEENLDYGRRATE